VVLPLLGRILPDALFERWCVKPAAAIIAALKVKHPDVPVIAFPRGAGLAYDGFAEATGADCIGLDATVPFKWAVQRVQRGLGRCVQGNLDPQLLVAGGPALYAETDRILRALSDGPFCSTWGMASSRPPARSTSLPWSSRYARLPRPRRRSTSNNCRGHRLTPDTHAAAIRANRSRTARLCTYPACCEDYPKPITMRNGELLY
jgi:hypothetical protein